MGGLDHLIGRIKQGLVANSYVNESAVSASIVVPILRALGWDDTDPNELRPQYRNARGLVDFALFAGPFRRATVFLEVKAVGNARGADQQLFEYAFHDGVPLGVLTDGRCWHIYLPMQQGAYAERRVSLIDIVSDDLGEVAAKLTRYLQRARIENGAAVSEAEHDYRKLASGRIAEAALPRAWSELLNAPDSPVVGWLTEKAAALCGHRPDVGLVASFLASKTGADVGSRARAVTNPTAALTSSPSSVRVDVAKLPAVTPNLPSRSVPDNRWRLFDQRGQGKNGVEAWHQLLCAIFERFPDKHTEIASAASTRGRNPIARSIAEIYPNVPGLAERSHRQLPGGWLLGTNESTATKLRILTQAIGVVGLVLDRDVELHI